MIRLVRNTTIAFLALLLTGCWFGDEETLTGRYLLNYTDGYENTSIVWDLGGGSSVGDGLPGPMVFAAGFNEKYIVAAVHPYNASRNQPDYRMAQFFYVIRLRDNNGKEIRFPYGRTKGPFTQKQFEGEMRRLHLPAFGWHLDRTFHGDGYSLSERDS